jgi:HPt (histidine-containing phosphotransfer) domain-containing protein
VNTDDSPNLSPELIKKYLQRRNEDLNLCERALANQDYETLQMIGHKILGNAGSFGFPELGQIGKLLETAAENRAHESLGNAIRSLQTWLKKHSPVDG